MNRVTSACVLASLLTGSVLFTAIVAGQTPATPAPQSLTYEMAVQVIDAAEAEARKNKWNVTIVVTDAAGVPVALRRLTGASPRSVRDRHAQGCHGRGDQAGHLRLRRAA